MINYGVEILKIEMALFSVSDTTYLNLEIFHNKIKEKFPELIFLYLTDDYETRILMKYMIEDHKGYVRVFYGNKCIIFEKESDKLLFLLKYGK